MKTKTKLIALLLIAGLAVLNAQTYEQSISYKLRQWAWMSGATAVLICDNNPPEQIDAYSYFKGKQDALNEAAKALEGYERR